MASCPSADPHAYVMGICSHTPTDTQTHKRVCVRVCLSFCVCEYACAAAWCLHVSRGTIFLFGWVRPIFGALRRHLDDAPFHAFYASCSPLTHVHTGGNVRVAVEGKIHLAETWYSHGQLLPLPSSFFCAQVQPPLSPPLCTPRNSIGSTKQQHLKHNTTASQAQQHLKHKARASQAQTRPDQPWP